MEDSMHLPPLWQSEEYSEEVRKQEERIRKHFGQGKDGWGEIRMDVGDMSFGLVRISSDDRENMERFDPYCEGSPEGKYGVIWKAGILEDRYVFDTWEYAVEFIVMSAWWKDDEEET